MEESFLHNYTHIFCRTVITHQNEEVLYSITEGLYYSLVKKNDPLVLIYRLALRSSPIMNIHEDGMGVVVR